MQKEKIGMENGRTMAEMLGVLALAGVLSIGGIVGYGYAMRLYQEAETLDQLSVLVAGGRSWDIPLHYGFQTVGIADDYVPYIIPIRDVVSRVRYRSEESAFDAGLIDEEGKLVGGDRSKMVEVREHESFDTLLDAPAWVRAEDENNWTVRVTGLSYTLCEKLLYKSDLGFDYAYVALQSQSGSPMDPFTPDFLNISKENKYANPERGGEEGIATKEQIDKVCTMIDPTKGNISLAQKYLRNLEDEDNPETAPGAGSVCENKKSLACMAYGARVDTGEKNEDGSKKMIPLQTLVLYFGQKQGIDLLPTPDMTCVPGTPYTEESGGHIESQECCELLGDDVVFIPGGPKCCKLVENIENTPRCKVGPDGRYSVRITAKTDATGKPVVDENGIPVYEETWVFDTDAITSEEEIYIGGNWAGEMDASCCPGEPPTTSITVPCHISSITGAVLPWTIATSKGSTSTQYQNCPLGSSSQTSEVTVDQCCIAGGGYWAEADGQVAGTNLTSETGKALCCSQNDVLAFRTASTTEQCPWEGVSNVPTLGTPITGAAPLDIMGTPTTDCCYKMEGLQKRLKTSACAYEGGVLKYSQECCNVATDMNGRKLSYVHGPHYQVGQNISQECGIIATAPTSVPEPDRNCCVDYKELERSGTALTYDQKIRDWSGMPSPEYCCQTLEGTSMSATEGDVKNNYKECCESPLYYNTTNPLIRSKGTFVLVGTTIQGYAQAGQCPTGTSGTTCYPTGISYNTTESMCCDLKTGQAIDGTESKICCDYASMQAGGKGIYWDGSKCTSCKKCTEGPQPNPDKCYDYCTYIDTIKTEEEVIPDTQEMECDTTVCKEINGNCCQEEGVLANGTISCACCPSNPSGLAYGDDCFIPRGLKNKPAKECFKYTHIPGSSKPGGIVEVERRKTLRTYDCPPGVENGYGTYVGSCPEEGVVGGNG